MKRSPQLEATLAELEKRGAKVVRLGNSARHGRVTFVYQGEERFLIVGLNASGPTAANAARAAVRHVLGIKREKVTGKRRIRRNYANRPAPTAPDHITIGPDPWSGIIGTPIAQRTAAFAADQAWARLFGLCLLNTSHVPHHPTIRRALGIAA